MKTSILIAAILVVGMSAYAHDSKPADVTIYVNGDNAPPSSVDFRAQATVTWMFAKVGVRLAWRSGEPKAGAAGGSPVTIRVQFSQVAPAGASPNALASALPFGNEGVTISIMYGRILKAAQRSSQQPAILAHVLAHEIAHVLQGTNQHAEAGVMKAQWSGHDYDAMEQKPLEFTSFDVNLIQKGLSARIARSTNALAAVR